MIRSARNILRGRVKYEDMDLPTRWKLMSLRGCMIDLARNIWRGIKNVVYWLPVMWKDRQWDHWYLLKLLEHKLRRMRDYHRESGLRQDRHAVADEIDRAASCATRLLEDRYLTEALKPHEKKYGVAQCITEPTETDIIQLVEIAVPELEGEEREREKEERYAIYRQSTEEAKQDLETLCATLRRMENWWD